MYLPTLLYFVLFFPPSWCPKILFFFFLIISFLFSELPSAILLRLSIPVTYSLNFLSSENVLISLPFQKDVFTGYRALCWQLFSFSTWEMCHFLLACMVSDEKSVIWTVSPIYIEYHLSCSDFSCCLFYKLDFELACYNFYGFILIFTQLLEFVGLYFLPNMEIFSHYFLKYIFNLVLFLPLLRIQWYKC